MNEDEVEKIRFAEQYGEDEWKIIGLSRYIDDCFYTGRYRAPPVAMVCDRKDVVRALLISAVRHHVLVGKASKEEFIKEIDLLFEQFERVQETINRGW